MINPDYVISTDRLSKKYAGTQALSDVSVNLEKDKIYGLLGRNGAGKTTLLRLLTNLDFPSSGTISIFEKDLSVDEDVLSSMILIREQGQFPEDMKGKQILESVKMFYKHYDDVYARKLVDIFNIDLSKRFKKLSRGMQSSLGIIVGLASRAEITIFDEPSLGLDVVSRQQFYDLLIEDYAEHPRTFIISTHLIDEISRLFESIIILDQGKVQLQQDTEDLRNKALYLNGKTDIIMQAVSTKKVLHLETFGSSSVAAVFDDWTEEEKHSLTNKGIELSSIPLQKLFMHLIQDSRKINMSDKREDVS